MNPATANCPPEFELITLFCRAAIGLLTNRTPPDPLAAARIGELVGVSGEGAIDPVRVTELCRRHQVGAITYSGLRANVEHSTFNAEHRTMVGEDGVVGGLASNGKACSSMDRLISGLEGQYLANVLRNEGLRREVLTVYGWLSEAGIRAVPFKGPVMAEQLYGDVAVRPCSDIDFILPVKDDLVRAKLVLESKGFRSIRTMTAAEDKVWRRAGWGYDMSSPGSEFTVDIAAGATPDYLPYALGADRFWDETREAQFNGSTMRVMTPELLLIFLCWHGTKHLWEKLVWVVDVHALITKEPGLDWGKVESLARESRTRRMVETGLEVVRRVLGEEVGNAEDGTRKAEKSSVQIRAGGRVVRTGIDKAGVGAKATDDRVNSAVTLCLERLSDRKISWFSEQLFFLRMHETPGERLRTVLRTMFRPTISDCQAIRLPPWLFGLYYVLRPMRLLGKIVAKVRC